MRCSHRDRDDRWDIRCDRLPEFAQYAQEVITRILIITGQTMPFETVVPDMFSEINHIWMQIFAIVLLDLTTDGCEGTCELLLIILIIRTLC